MLIHLFSGWGIKDILNHGVGTFECAFEKITLDTFFIPCKNTWEFVYDGDVKKSFLNQQDL